MNRSGIIEAIASSKRALQDKDVLRLVPFGSYARGDAHAGTGLDVLVDIAPTLPIFSLVDLAGIEPHPIDRKALANDPRFARRIADGIAEVASAVLHAAVRAGDMKRTFERSAYLQIQRRCRKRAVSRLADSSAGSSLRRSIGKARKLHLTAPCV